MRRLAGAAAAVVAALVALGRLLGQPEAPPDTTPHPTSTLVARSAAQRTETLAATATPPAEALLPAVPRIDDGMRARLQAIHRLGLERGMRPNVFAKIGDSITLSGFFLTEIGCGAVLDGHEELAPTVAWFAAGDVPQAATYARCDATNPFTRLSLASGTGWITAQALAPFDESPDECPSDAPTPLACEIALTRPSVALVMFGTNDLASDVDLATYRAALQSVATQLEAAGVIPILSTIPPRSDDAAADVRVHAYNAVLIQLTGEMDLPLWNYWRAMRDGSTLVDEGMDLDGVHPNAYGYGGHLGASGLAYGYNRRNLTALQILEALRAQVLEPPR